MKKPITIQCVFVGQGNIQNVLNRSFDLYLSRILADFQGLAE